MKIEHRWTKDEVSEAWGIYCEIEKNTFSPRCEVFDNAGRC